MTDAKTKPFNLSAIDTAAACDKPFKLEFEHPTTRAPLGFGVTLLGKDSATAKEHLRRTTNEKLRKHAFQAKRGKDEVPTVERFEADGIDLLVACTTGIWGDVEFEGKALTSQPDDVRTLYTRFSQLREQVDEAFGNLENFIKA